MAYEKKLRNSKCIHIVIAERASTAAAAALKRIVMDRQREKGQTRTY